MRFRYVVALVLVLAGRICLADAWTEEFNWDAADAQVSNQCSAFAANYGAHAKCKIDHASFEKFRTPKYFEDLSRKLGAVIGRLYYPAVTCTTKLMNSTIANNTGGAHDACYDEMLHKRCRKFFDDNVKNLVCVATPQQKTSFKYDRNSKTIYLYAGTDIDYGDAAFDGVFNGFLKEFPIIKKTLHPAD